MPYAQGRPLKARAAPSKTSEGPLRNPGDGRLDVAKYGVMESRAFFLVSLGCLQRMELPLPLGPPPPPSFFDFLSFYPDRQKLAARPSAPNSALPAVLVRLIVAARNRRRVWSLLGWSRIVGVGTSVFVTLDLPNPSPAVQPARARGAYPVLSEAAPWLVGL